MRDFIAENDDKIDGDDKYMQLSNCEISYGFIEYFHTGDNRFYLQQKLAFILIKEIAELNNEPSIWWVIRLFIIDF